MRAQWMRCAAGGLLAGLIACVPARAQPAGAPVGAGVEGFRAAGRGLSPTLRAAALDSEAASAKAAGADALDDPAITDSYQYYRDPGVFSAHTVMLSQSFPLWGKRGLRREAALADVDASRGRELAERDELDEKIKIAYAQYYLSRQDIAVNTEIAELARRMRKAATARYGQGSGDQSAVILAAGEETTAKLEAARLEGEKGAVRARLNVLAGRAADMPLAEPERPRPMPAAQPDLAALIARARTANPSLAASTAAIAAARTRRMLADKAWYPDLTIGAGPVVQTNHQPVGFAATAGFNIPLGWGREASGQREAAAQMGAAQQRYEAARLEIEGALAEAIARLRAARATEALLRREAAPQARAVFETVLASYSQGKGELTAAISAEHQKHEVDLRLHQARFNEQVEMAAIERLIGSDL